MIATSPITTTATLKTATKEVYVKLECEKHFRGEKMRF